MNPDLTNALDTVRQFPHDRQRDAVSCAETVLAWSEKELQKHYDRYLKFKNEPIIEFTNDFYKDFPKHLTVQVVSRSPIEPDVTLTSQLRTCIEKLKKISSSRQEYIADIFKQMIETDSQEAILTPEQKRELESAVRDSQ